MVCFINLKNDYSVRFCYNHFIKKDFKEGSRRHYQKMKGAEIRSAKETQLEESTGAFPGH